MTKIEHKDGSTVLDGWTYALDDNGDITKTTNADSSYWDYYYDNRHRLTKAERFNSGATIKAKYQYTYDAGDSMITKLEPFLDDFNDGAYTGWSVWGGTWSASSTAMKNTSAGAATVMRSNTDANIEFWFRYKNENTSNSGYSGYFWPRYVDGSNRMLLYIQPGGLGIQETYTGSTTTLDSDTGFATTQDVWYNYHVVMDGANIDVYRYTDGNVETKVLSTTSSQLTTTSVFGFATSANGTHAFDDLKIASDSLSSTTTMTYAAGNELSTLTDPNGAQTYTFDAWGRMISKTRGGSAATYAYSYGSMLTAVTSNFPGEGAVTYQYGADQKRRQRDDGTITKYNWDGGWSEIEEENSGGTLTMTYVPGLAQLASSDPASGTASYYYSDNFGSGRSTRDSAKSSMGQYEFSPFGTVLSESGEDISSGFRGYRSDRTARLYFEGKQYYSTVSNSSTSGHLNSIFPPTPDPITRTNKYNKKRDVNAIVGTKVDPTPEGYLSSGYIAGQFRMLPTPERDFEWAAEWLWGSRKEIFYYSFISILVGGNLKYPADGKWRLDEEASHTYENDMFFDAPTRHVPGSQELLDFDANFETCAVWVGEKAQGLLGCHLWYVYQQGGLGPFSYINVLHGSSPHYGVGHKEAGMGTSLLNSSLVASDLYWAQNGVDFRDPVGVYLDALHGN